ncbi:MAG: hypothetical protein L6R42_000258 [Xanthoria sp. 1 TBL-2021]|nr:MAG: hypothetical protein L6R42_000258 [Xanthoria sp. 1 TBL-2021]
MVAVQLRKGLTIGKTQVIKVRTMMPNDCLGLGCGSASLDSLLGEEILKDDVVIAIVKLLNVEDSYVVDPVNVTGRFGDKAPIREKQRFGSSPMAILIINHPNDQHLSLAVFRRNLPTLHYYNSWGSDRVYEHARQASMDKLEWLTTDISHDCATQKDGISCGIYVLANLQAALANAQVGSYTDTALDEHYANLSYSGNLVADDAISHKTAARRMAISHQQQLEAGANTHRLKILESNTSLHAAISARSAAHKDMLRAEDVMTWYQ